MINIQKQPLLAILSLPIILAMVSLGCGMSGLAAGEPTVQIEPSPTRTPMPTFTPALSLASWAEPVDDPPAHESIAAEIPTNTPTLVILPTDPPAPTPTNTPNPDPRVTILQNMNVRTGPGTDYPVIGPGSAGETSNIIGRNADSSWVQIQYTTANGSGWVYAPLVQLDGDLNMVPLVEVAPPPAPTATPTPEPTPTPAEPPPTPKPQYQFTPTGWHASENEGIIHFKGRIRDEGGNLVNGYSVLLDNGAWSVVSHPAGPSRHYPQKGPGEWDVVIAKEVMGQALGWWNLTVVRYDCPNFHAGFDAQCKQFTRLSEDIPIMVNWPDETIINADWVCHWDCDKGVYSELYLGN